MNVERALITYADSCAQVDGAAVSNVFTDDARIEYGLPGRPGYAVAVDAAVADRCWVGAADLHEAKNPLIWIYPMTDPNTAGHTMSIVILFNRMYD